MTRLKIENIIKKAYGQWTPECRIAADDIWLQHLKENSNTKPKKTPTHRITAKPE